MQAPPPQSPPPPHPRQECLRGTQYNPSGATGATVFPMPIGWAATFDPALVRDVAAAIAAEAQFKVAAAYGASATLDGTACFAPNVNLLRVGAGGGGGGRSRRACNTCADSAFKPLLIPSHPCVPPPQDPRWGRAGETFGEDPLVVSQMGAAFVQGLQGPDRNRVKVAATCKHFIAGDMEMWYGVDRMSSNAGEPPPASPLARADGGCG